jgi:sarcosine oxidase subunit beta
MKRTAEVVIIGGGITGVATAFNLAKRGCRDVVLLEKGYLASGSTGRCGAGVRQQWGLEMNCLLAKGACEQFENLNEILEYDGDIEFHQGGYLLLATTEKEVEQFKKNIKLQNSLGINSKLLSVEEAREIVPYLNTEGILACAFHQKDGHANPFYTTQAYADAAKRLGVEINTYTTVTDIKVERGRVVGVVTDKGEISTNKVLNAAGGWAGQIAEMAGVSLPIYPERHEALVTEPIERLIDPMVMSFSFNIYCQQTPHGSFVMGYGDPNEKPGVNLKSSWHFIQTMAKKVTAILPIMENVRVVRQWAGLYTMTPDAAPILGSVPEVEGFYVAVGFSGHGFMLGPMTGILMAEHILGMAMTLPIDKLDVGRFERGELIQEPSVV